MAHPIRWLAVLLLLAAAPAAAQMPPADIAPTDRQAIRQVIESQMDAFGRDDGATAFGFASPAIQALFGTPENFLAMVRQGYAAVYRPRSVAFGDIVGEAARPVQLVHVVGPDGEAVIAAYEMTRLADGPPYHGAWRINGCVLLRPPQQAT